jgi:hypothetical protein
MPRQKNGQVSYHKKQQPVRCQAAEGLWLGFFLVPLGRGGCQLYRLKSNKQKAKIGNVPRTVALSAQVRLVPTRNL